LTAYKSGAEHNKINQAKIFLRNLVFFQRYQSHPSTNRNKKVRLGDSDGLSINEGRNENKLEVIVGAVPLITYKPNFACWLDLMFDTLYPSFSSLRPLTVEKSTKN